MQLDKTKKIFKFLLYGPLNKKLLKSDYFQIAVLVVNVFTLIIVEWHLLILTYALKIVLY